VLTIGEGTSRSVVYYSHLLSSGHMLH